MAKHAVESTSQSESKITLAVIKEQMGPLIYDITSMKFEARLLFYCTYTYLTLTLQNPNTSSEAQIISKYNELYQRMQDAFHTLEEF